MSAYEVACRAGYEQSYRGSDVSAGNAVLQLEACAVIGDLHGGGGCRLVLDAERWLELRGFRALRQADATISEIARETGLNWRTVKKYLEAEGPAAGGKPLNLVPDLRQ